MGSETSSKAAVIPAPMEVLPRHHKYSNVTANAPATNIGRRSANSEIPNIESAESQSCIGGLSR
jgi:hypothetical protein